jgi:hypothetical protein
MPKTDPFTSIDVRIIRAAIHALGIKLILKTMPA